MTTRRPALARATRPLARVAVAASVLVFACACQTVGLSSGPQLSTGGPINWTVNGIPGIGPSNHADIGEFFLCLTAPGRAVITGVRPVRPIGTVEVVAFAVRPNPLLTGGVMLGSGSGTLQDNGFNLADRVVDKQCVSDSGQGYELGLELTVPAGTNAGTRAFEIDYKVDDRAASLTYPEGVALCSTPTVGDPACRLLYGQLGLATGP